MWETYGETYLVEPVRMSRFLHVNTTSIADALVVSPQEAVETPTLPYHHI